MLVGTADADDGRYETGPIYDPWWDRRALNAWVTCFRVHLQRRRGDVVGADEALAEMGAVLTLETHPKLTHQRIEQVVETVAIIAISEGWSEALRGKRSGRDADWMRVKRVIYKATKTPLPWSPEPKY